MNPRSRFLLLGALACASFLIGCATGDPGDAAPVEGAGERGALRVEPASVRFEPTASGCVREANVSLRNADEARPLRITGFRTPNGAIQLDAALPIELAPGEARSFPLRFAPATAGDWSGSIALASDDPAAARAALAVTARATGASQAPEQLESLGALDLVFVLDVSTTMDEMAPLRRAIRSLVGFVERNGLDVRLGLTTFENDVVAHADARFLTSTEFFQELDSQLLVDSWVPNPELPRQQLNFDLPENLLGALHRSATQFPFRPGSRRILLVMTDDTFLEPPAVFSDGTPALFSYAQVSQALTEHGIRLVSVHASARGAGLSSGHDGAPSLVAATRGTWFELASVSSGVLALDGLLADVVAGGSCAATPSLHAGQPTGPEAE